MTNVGELIARVRLRARLNRLPCLRPLMWRRFISWNSCQGKRGYYSPFLHACSCIGSITGATLVAAVDHLFLIKMVLVTPFAVGSCGSS